MSATKYWRENADRHAKDLVRTLRLYFKGYMQINAVEQALRKVIKDSALWTQQDIDLNMDEVKQLMHELRISVPRKFQHFFPNSKIEKEVEEE